MGNGLGTTILKGPYDKAANAQPVWAVPFDTTKGGPVNMSKVLTFYKYTVICIVFLFADGNTCEWKFETVQECNTQYSDLLTFIGA